MFSILNQLWCKNVEGFEEAYPDTFLHSQLRKYIGKKVKVWAAGRQRSWKGVLLQIGSDFLEISGGWGSPAATGRYILLNQIVLIEPQE
jgi:hypothetical protein